MRGLRKYDVSVEKYFANYLQQYLYPRLGVDSFQPVFTRDLQYAGVDVFVENNGKQYAIDEKLAAHYMNTAKDNFVLELVTPKGNKGWFVDDEKQTDIYAFIWGRLNEVKFPVRKDERKTDYFKRMYQEDITGAFVLFVKRKKLLDYFSRHGYSPEFLYRIGLSFRSMPRNKGVHWKLLCDRKGKQLEGVKGVVYSSYLFECPVNIVLQQRLLQELSFCYGLVTDKTFWFTRATA